MNIKKRTQNMTAEKQAQFRKLVEENKKNIYFLSLKLTGNHHDAEDLSQEVFIKVYKNFDSFRHEAKISSWLYRITVNTHINRNRNKMRKNLHSTEKIESVASAYTEPPAETNPERAARSGIIKAHIEDALSKLSARERSVFVLSHYNDMPRQEIADMLDIKTGTVKSTLFRAVAKLRRELSYYKQEMEAARE